MSVTLYFIRHGEAASSWDKAPDPGLSDLGHKQATEVSQTIRNMTDPIPVFTSPLKRAQETAAPLAKAWDKPTEVVSQISEIPSTNIPFDERRNWLNTLMSAKWAEQPENLLSWKNNILDVVRAQKSDAVFFTHFMVINTIVAAVEGEGKIVSFRPDNCSVTTISVENDEIKLIERGREAITIIQ